MALNKRPWLQTGNTILIPAATTAPAAIQASNTNTNATDLGVQVRIHNAGSQLAFVGFGGTTAIALANAVIPVAGTPALGVPIPAGAIEVWTVGTNAWFSAITASGTANVYVTPGDGV